MIRAALAAATAALMLASATTATAATTTAASSNWAGYSVSGTTYSSVSGSWTQPAADFAKTLRMSAPDISSAKWIAEAPSAITHRGTQILPQAPRRSPVSSREAEARSASRPSPPRTVSEAGSQETHRIRWDDRAI